ncbi:MAG: glucose-1-phosphate adenylyltransferase [Planctomycetaceae bacterium]
MPFPTDTLSIVLAGGVGSRLAPLTDERAKPAVPFGGQYRIVDFTLSNCLHSGLRRILVLTQYKSDSLHNHLRDAWSVFSPQLGEHITAVPPQLRTGDSWYRGTADAICQNLHLLKRSGAKNVLILSGDHIYRMDYSRMLDAHRETNADVSVACMEVTLDEARSFGVMAVDQQQRVRRFDEKPDQPQPTPDNPERALASMGVYVFSVDLLCRELQRDAQDTTSSHDFGKDLLPRLIHTQRVFGYRFGHPDPDATNNHCESYWRDVGTIDSYHRANMDLLLHRPPLNLYSDRWPIRKYETPAPPARIDRDENGVPGAVTDSMLSNGVMVSGGMVNRSILSPNVRVASDARVSDSVLFDGVYVGAGAVLKNCIVDKGVHIPAGETIGVDALSDRERFTVSENGVTVVPKGYQFVTKPALPRESRSRIMTNAAKAVLIRAS